MDLQQPAANLSELCRSCEHPLGKAGTIFGAGAEGRSQVLFEQGNIKLLRETRDFLRKNWVGNKCECPMEGKKGICLPRRSRELPRADGRRTENTESPCLSRTGESKVCLS